MVFDGLCSIVMAWQHDFSLKKTLGACVCRALRRYLFFLPGNIRRRDVTCFNVLNQLSAMKTGRGCMQWSSTCASLKLAFLGLESSTSTATIWILNGIFDISFESFCLLLFVIVFVYILISQQCCQLGFGQILLFLKQNLPESLYPDLKIIEKWQTTFNFWPN